MNAPFVLVHGAWHGGWCWQRVTPLLRAAGHEVYAPSLTGVGDRAHLAGGKIDLETHIADVCGLIEMEDLAGVVLVGHSYAGMVITGVADRAAARLKSLVYVDAFVPEDPRLGRAAHPAPAARNLDAAAAPPARRNAAAARLYPLHGSRAAHLRPAQPQAPRRLDVGLSRDRVRA